MKDTTYQKNRRLLFIVTKLKQRDWRKADLLKVLNEEESKGEQRAQIGSLYLQGVTARTLQRDIQTLWSWGARIGQEERGVYRLENKDWVFPEVELERDELMASFFVRELTRNHLPGQLREHGQRLFEKELAVGESSEEAELMVRNLVQAVRTLKDPGDDEAIDAVITAWRDCRQVEIVYETPQKAKGEPRVIDCHALFLFNSAWYVRAWCHRRRKDLAFALNRISSATLLTTPYERDMTVVAEVKKGFLFPYEKVRDVHLRCSAKVAQTVQERDWFEGQVTEDREGNLELRIDCASKEQLLWWVGGFLGEIEIVAPPELRQEVHQAALLMQRKHEANPDKSGG